MFGHHSRLATAALGMCAGAALGALIGGSGVSAFSPSGEGPGYGGDAKALEVVVVGDSVRISGSGFLAASDVTVTVGALTTSVVADEFGNIDTTVSADGGAPITAAGVSPTGSPTSSAPQLDAGATGTSAVMIGAGLGAVPSLLRTRRQRSR